MHFRARLAMTELAKSFDPAPIEAKYGCSWEQRGLYNPSLDTNKPSFCIQLPPPNVTGTLHMGHAFNQTIMDSLTRYHRMRDFNTLWVPGTDHAGIATQIVVERQLQEQGLSRHDLGRSAFVEKVWEWKKQSGSTITRQMRRMGDSVSWAHEYFTMDPRLNGVVNDAFVRLFDEGMIYRGKRMVSWDPILKSAVSDLEVESEEENGHLWHIRYPIENDAGFVEVATTRPETMFGDAAVMVHPQDPRYRAAIGKMVRLPVSGRLVPIIADEHVDPDFGTGAVKVTPAHDFNDYQVALRHDLPILTIFTLDAKLNEMVPQPYQGLDRFDARKKLIKELTALGQLTAVKDHKLMVPRCARTGQIIEPMLTDQWFVAMTKPGRDGQSIASKAIDAVDSGEVQFVPTNWVSTYNQWMKNIQDWCISRQLWWGHQIPAWYGTCGEVFVARTEEEARSKAAASGYDGPLSRDEDVLDTWFSASLLPFSTLGWPSQTKELELFLPSTVLITAFDIIFFWVARMIMLTKHFTGRVPFKHVYIHGLVRDAQGQKMSKSEGNVLDPVDLIDGIELAPLLEKRTKGLRKPETAPKIRKATEKEFPNGIPGYGADALRFTFASVANLGRSINFDSKRCEGYRNFCNKLWNATRFVLMNCEGQDCGTDEGRNASNPAFLAPEFSHADRWIMGELQRVTSAVHQGFSEFRLDNVASAIYQFVWDEYCDWYLEIAKVQIQAGSSIQQRATRQTLIYVLEATLRLLHPITPFITEELWQAVAPIAGRKAPGSDHTIVIAPYPESDLNLTCPQSDAWVNQLKALVSSIRNLRSEMNLSPAHRVPLLTTGASPFIAQAEPLLMALGKLEAVALLDDAEFALATAMAPVSVHGDARLALHVEVDVETEKVRLHKEVLRLEGELAKAQIKLDNQDFVARAPVAVVEQEKRRLTDFSTALERTRHQYTRLDASAQPHPDMLSHK